MDQQKPLISVVMPAYNVQKYIGPAIESILKQTFNNFELIIINDASTDKTLDTIKTYSKKDSRIKIVDSKERLNIARALNQGITLAKSDIIARMDADDIAFSHRLKLQYTVINASHNIAVVGANVVIIDEAGNEISTRSYPVSSRKLKACLFRYSPFAHPVVMFKKRMFREVGGYNPAFSPTEDLDLWFRLGRRYEFVSIPEPLLKYRLFKASSSHKALKELELLVFKIRFDALTKYGYRPSMYDVMYNLLQFFTLWFMPAKFRIMLYNYLRNNNLI